MLRKIALAALIALGASSAFAGDANVGDLMLMSAWSPATPKGATVGAGYVTIHNHGATADKLIGGSADFADVQVHEMKKAGAVMQMRELKDGLPIPANGEIKLAPGGYHFMFVNLKKPLVKGDKEKVTLKFEHAGSVDIDFDVQGVGAAAPGGMNGMKM